jgi:hypothetical protein
VADVGMDQGYMAIRCLRRLALRALLALGEPERAADRHHDVCAERLDMASMRRAADQSAG